MSKANAAAADWGLSLATDQTCESFRKVLDEARLDCCSAGLDIVLFSIDENGINAALEYGTIVLGFVHSTHQIRKTTIESWINDPHVTIRWTQVRGPLHKDPLIRKFLDESHENGASAGLKRRISYLGNCAATPKKPSRSPCPYKSMSVDQLSDALRKSGQPVSENLTRAELLRFLRQKDPHVLSTLIVSPPRTQDSITLHHQTSSGPTPSTSTGGSSATASAGHPQRQAVEPPHIKISEFFALLSDPI